MTIYAVGDIQGCLQPLLYLLKKVEFNPKKDKLWAVGDLVNRGSESLETLRFLRELGTAVQVVLGNHDLHLLAVAQGIRPCNDSDTFQSLLSAPDLPELLHWLRQWPLVHHDPRIDITMVHAGIAPSWSLDHALAHSDEVTRALKDDRRLPRLLRNINENQPCLWHNKLNGVERLQTIISYCTHMRFCDSHGGMEFSYTGSTQKPYPSGYQPWFMVSPRAMEKQTIIFGHWAALHGETGQDNAIALDTGYVWGKYLTLMRLSDRKRFICLAT